MDELVERLTQRPAAVGELLSEQKVDRKDLSNRLQALKAKGRIWVLNIQPLWFAKGYKLRKGATNEEIREYSLAMWYVYDPDQHDPIKRAQRLLKDISEAKGTEQ